MALSTEHLADTASRASDATIAAAAGKTTGAGGLTAVVGGLIDSDFVSGVGIVLAIAGFAVQVIFSIRRDRRERAIHELRVLEMKHRLASGRPLQSIDESHEADE